MTLTCHSRRRFKAGILQFQMILPVDLAFGNACQARPRLKARGMRVAAEVRRRILRVHDRAIPPRHLGGYILNGLLALLLVGLTGCAHHRESSLQRSEAARALFERTTKEFHLPSAEAQGAVRLQLQEEAAAGYRELIKEYPDQRQWAAQALRSLGNIRAAQTNLNQAVKYYQAVGQRYPDQAWEVLMAWKSAADLLWDASRQPEAASFYKKIVARFDVPEAPQVIQTVVHGSKRRLAETK